ncbi:IS3 family transposase [Streptomyces antimycoticus]|uniref:IS3 family transposase n=1 Tax=Streptomyces antimycoticus TaxID=68175 RepID=UPI003530538B
MIHLASKGAYGVPRVRAELQRLGRAVNRKRVARIVRERGITGVTRRRRRVLRRWGISVRTLRDQERGGPAAAGWAAGCPAKSVPCGR